MPRIAIVEPEKCNPVGCGGHLCIRVCPINRKGDNCVYKAESGKAGIDEVLCIGCMICTQKCPFNAINIINLPDELATQPVHFYGRNLFHLYNLALPQFGKVIGLLGRNGIGKSTAIKILAGILQPNLGEYEEEVPKDKILDFFKGTAAQNFFEKVFNGEITVAYKPQHIEPIASKAKGTVKELLTKVDERNMLEEIAQKLDIVRVFDRKLPQLSGGELQRVAIAATVLKKADLYVLDEPLSYLDVKQRINMAQFVKEMVNSDTAVLVVEHDLIMIDAMMDLLQIVYGKEACYGIISGTKPIKAGLNTYLEGYLREENMRFRDHPIKVQPSPPFSIKQPVELLSWKNINKKLGSFSLIANQGSIKKGEIVGVLGENGLGKTSFVKILAGELKADKGELSFDAVVSYKPQQIEIKSNDIVATYLGEVNDHSCTKIIQQLGVEELMDKKLRDLSGGELQKVQIVHCLKKEADIYLFDEPSAYLDIEQRLLLARLLREEMEHRDTAAIVVDHDLLFLDHIAQDLLVFSGEPAVQGSVQGPFSMGEGMNTFLKEQDVTMRRDKASGMPWLNKKGSVLDREQKKKNKYFY